MKEFQAIVTFHCDTDEQAATFRTALDECVKNAEQTSLIRDGTVDVREEILGELRDFPEEDIDRLSVELDYDDIFVPKRGQETGSLPVDPRAYAIWADEEKGTGGTGVF